MPIVDDHSRRSRSEIFNVTVQRIELFGHFENGKFEKATAEPVLGSAQTAGFAGSLINRAVWQSVWIARR